MINNSFANDIYGVKMDSFIKSGLNSRETMNQKKLIQAASEFESLLVYEMMKEMNKNISFHDQEDNKEEDNIFIKKNQAEKIFNDFLTYERSKETVSKSLKLGLTEAIIKQISPSVNVSRETFTTLQ